MNARVLQVIQVVYVEDGATVVSYFTLDGKLLARVEQEQPKASPEVVE